jgi:hypothetical protein
MSPVERDPRPAARDLTVAEKRAQALAECARLVEHFNRHAKRNKRTFQWLRYSALVLTVAVATMAALESVPRWGVAIVSGIAALCTALLTASRPQEVWLQSRGTSQRLTAERFLFEQGVGDYATDDENARVRIFADRVITVWAAGHARWEQSRQEAANQPVVSKV